MAEPAREVWITGMGIVSCLGEGPQAHWEGLNQDRIAADTAKYSPYVVHPLAPLDFDKQIPKKGDQRQMEPWQRIGTYAAGLALDSAGVKGDAELLGRTDMIVAAGHGERDIVVDEAILSELAHVDRPAAILNERLMSNLRPTLFLAQLSNLLAGNISIVHGVTGSSRTFMGEEAAGVDAVRIAHVRISAGQSEIALVGGAHNAERMEQLLLYEAGGYALKGAFAPVWERVGERAGMALGSLGAFLVIESREHAEARGAAGLARLVVVTCDRAARTAGSVTDNLQRMWREMNVGGSGLAVISGASGAEPATSEERAFLASLDGLPIRATGSHIGHGLEPQFAMNIALAVIAIGHGRLFPPVDAFRIEQPYQGVITKAVVTGVGHWRGEGLALVKALG